MRPDKSRMLVIVISSESGLGLGHGNDASERI